MTVSFLYIQTSLKQKANNTSELANWLVNAFNGEWLRTANAVPLQIDAAEGKRSLELTSV